MDAYDTGSEARHGPDGPRASEAPADPAPPRPRPSSADPAPARPQPSLDQPSTADPAATGPQPSPAGSAAPRPQPSPADLAPPRPQPSPAVTAAPRPQPSYGPYEQPSYGPYDSPSGPVGADPRSGVAALSLRYQIGAALALAVVAVTVCVHLGVTFLHVAPANAVTKQHGRAIDDWIYPEFEQNWKLFAPNPLQQNIAVQVRAQVLTGDGTLRTTGWYDLSAEDGRAIDGNLLPSHTQQNELRRAWDFFTATHGPDNRPVGLRGALSETYLRRIVLMRLDRDGAAGPGGSVERVQVRSVSTNVRPPDWSQEQVSDKPTHRELPWWPVTSADHGGGAR
ncbi:hypothetical protein DI272_23090 [Streptomyces sp. Act143]|uniref:DUF5819 family protein n=1 Tax=Streptomyces sp. Act143 TaxID=2200760 RepID=UPI000D67F81E|nr:DUF5819 family protein [Streptomyces sp. Act143]PWI16724.1 hypothetical protein DI272_23090 [Streptomyces sp. Act143]